VSSAVEEMNAELTKIRTRHQEALVQAELEVQEAAKELEVITKIENEDERLAALAAFGNRRRS
jgi:hypothetical protein